jgi:hypothetical protein
MQVRNKEKQTFYDEWLRILQVLWMKIIVGVQPQIQDLERGVTVNTFSTPRSFVWPNTL